MQARRKRSLLRLFAAIGSVWLAAAAATAQAPPPVILSKPGAKLASALSARLQAARVLELTGDNLADGALVAREARGAKVVYAVGPDATEAAGLARGTAVVSLGVANPAQLKTPGTYVSIYPSLDAVFAYLKGTLKATSAGLVFSPSKNREIALTFMRAGPSHGVNVVPVAVGSDGELVRAVKPALAKVDVLLLAVDPLLFDPLNLRFVVGAAQEARKLTVGFLEDLTGRGVPVSLLTSAEAAADAAVGASSDPVLVGKKRVEVTALHVVVSREAAAAVGWRAEALGAQKIQ
jgi:ABC-type uncharacterized transport system substrate-binding protein